MLTYGLQTASYGGYRPLSSTKVSPYAPPTYPAPTPSPLRGTSTILRDHAIFLSMILANGKLTAGWAFGFPRVKGFSSSQFLRYEPETSGMCVTLLGVYNDIRSKSNSNGVMPN